MRIGVFSVVDHYPSELPRSTSEFYEELLEQAQSADALGFDSFWVAEHHFHEYGAIPRPAIWLSAAAQRTRRIRLGTAVVVLPFDQPVRIAEDYAMVDILSGGRLNLGVGSGYLKHEFDGFDLDPGEKRTRFDESLEIILKGWEGEEFAYKGSFFDIPSIKLNVLPIQKPRPPVLIASLRSETAPYVGAQGFPVMLIPYATSEGPGDVEKIAVEYKKAYKQAGHTGEPRIVVSLHLHCGETTKYARAEVSESVERYVRTRLYAKQRSFEELLNKDLVAAGDSAEVTRVIKAYADAGATDFLAITNFGGMPHEKVMRSLNRMASDVLPSFSAAPLQTSDSLRA